MNFDYYLRDKKRLVSIVLLWFSVFLSVLILVKVAGFFVSSASAKNVVAKAVAQNKPDANDMEKFFAKSKAIADELKKKNLFVMPEKKKHPVSKVSGILGNEALINGKWYKVGDKIGDAKIVAIEPTQVKIEWEGKEKVFAPIKAASAPAPKKVVKKPVVKEKIEDKKVAAPVEKAVEVKVTATTEVEDPLAFMGVQLSPKLREKLMEHWNKASDEEKEKMKEEWNKIPDDQKQQMIDQMEQNIDMIP